MKTVIIVVLFALSLAAADKAAIQEFTNANNLFSHSVYKEIAGAAKSNFMVSPFSIEAILALAQSGRKGENAQEIRNALHFPEDKKLKSTLICLAREFRNNEFYTIRCIDKVNDTKKFALDDQLKIPPGEVYHTHNEDIDSNNSTTKRSFYRTPTDVVEVDTLTHHGEYFNYYESPSLKAQFLELPFQGGEASIVIVLPNDKNGLASLENQLDQVLEKQHQLKSEYLSVVLPKFAIRGLIDFEKILPKVGVKRVFNEVRASLRDKDDFIIEEMRQMTYIDVLGEDVQAEYHTEALVVVSKGADQPFTYGIAKDHIIFDGRREKKVQPTSVKNETPKNFTADHPFIFYIKWKDLIVFEGRVTDPTKR